MKQLAVLLITICFCPFVHSQVKANASRLVSPIDESLTIQKLALAPAEDNIKGLFAQPLFEELKAVISADPQFDMATIDPKGPAAPENFQENPKRALALIESAKAQALISLRVERGVKGTSLVLGMNTLPDGRILFLQKTPPIAEASLDALRKDLDQLYQDMKAKIPFDGRLLSRRGQIVTINLGARQNVRLGEVMDVVQIIKLERHPKFDFVVSSVKTALGTVEITKVDEALSFGRIVTEREAGIIYANAKIDRRDFVSYPSAQQGPKVSNLSDKDVAFGDSPREWVPVSSPTFGSALLYLGLGTYNTNIDIDSTSSSSAQAKAAEGSHTGKASLVPSIALEGEIWINPNWSILAKLDQSAFRMENPVSGASPSEINAILSDQALLVGYNFLLTENFFGPKLQFLAGFGSQKNQLDGTEPLLFSSTTYSGFRLGIKGDMDLPSFTNLRLGASLVFIPAPKLSTAPKVGGSSRNTLTQFRFYGTYKLGERYRLYSGLDIQSFNTNFAGSKNRSDENLVNSTSQAHTRVLIGAQYLF